MIRFKKRFKGSFTRYYKQIIFTLVNERTNKHIVIINQMPETFVLNVISVSTVSIIFCD